MRTAYPIVSSNEDLLDFCKEIQRLRETEDIEDFNNLKDRFLEGRKGLRIPSSPSDVLSTDKEGDLVTDAASGYEYRLVDNSGTLVWARYALTVSW